MIQQYQVNGTSFTIDWDKPVWYIIDKDPSITYIYDMSNNFKMLSRDIQICKRLGYNYKRIVKTLPSSDYEYEY